MRYFFRRKPPAYDRMLLVESGSRPIVEAAIPQFRALYGYRIAIDLLTCLPGLPQVLNPATTRVYRVTDCRTGADRRRLLAQLRAARYPILGILCTEEPVMTPWKIAAMALLPSKVFIVNENADLFWVDWWHRKTIRQFIFYRAGLLDDAAVRKLAQIVTFPFILAFLTLNFAYVHLRRFHRLLTRHKPLRNSNLRSP